MEPPVARNTPSPDPDPEPPFPPRPPAWDTPEGRVQWLVREHFDGNRSAFAQMIGFSHTAVGFVMKGKPPGRKLLAAVAERLHVNATWLLTGKGVPFLNMPGGTIDGVPIAERPLPGSPQEARGLLTDERVDDAGRLFAASQYWLRLRRGTPILRDPGRRFLVDDLLLMETDRRRYPPPDTIGHDLCAVRLPAERGKAPRVKLGLVTRVEASVDEDEHLEADTFDLAVDPTLVVREDVYQTYPDQQIRHVVRHRRLPDRGAARAGDPDDLPLHGYGGVRIDYGSIVGVWTRLLRRP